VRSCWNLPLCPAEPMPAGSKMDRPLAKAINNGGSASRIAELSRGGRKQPERGVSICERNNPAGTKVSAEGR